MGPGQVDFILMKGRTPLDEPELVSQLNALLTSLRIPVHLISPTDLTPRLLIVILESILAMRIPFERQDDSLESKVQNMKIFMGVLETDILKVDVGLSLLDPRRLARGEREAVVFIAELLCWIGRRRKFIKVKKIRASEDGFLSPSRARELQPSNVVVTPTKQSSRRYSSPAYYPPDRNVETASAFQSGSTWTDNSTLPDNSPFTHRSFDDESFTSLNTDDLPLLQPPFNPTKRERPRCIHEITSPSILGSPAQRLPSTPPRESTSNASGTWCPEHSRDFCMCDPFGWPERSPPVRHTGYIKPVDEESEIASFELSRSMSTSSDRSVDISLQDNPVPALKSVRERYTRTLELLNERARLLTHLAELKKPDPDPDPFG